MEAGMLVFICWRNNFEFIKEEPVRAIETQWSGVLINGKQISHLNTTL